MSATELKEVRQTTLFKPLANQVAIVTGASRGIGAEIAKVLADKGATVVATYSSSEEKMQKVIHEITEKGGHAIALRANVSEAEDSKHLIEEVLKQFSKVDILINNAGITKDRSFRKMSKDEWDQVINVNLNGIFHTTSAIINHMIERKYGRIINISSIIGQAGGFGQTNYAASKAGILGFTKSLALETAKNGITVNAVCPGFIETEMVAAMPENVKENIVSKVPMQRLGTTSEIAEAVLYLIQASFVTGQEINVNGGLYM
ncbi:3-oxoacyl-[acyl-carrier-protein] reductase [Rummeliibacillus pycnus]|uniref:3-oxoacyl-[acyl-carrier-protein] reductase n=1 Tax=Rummeliibacillus pycnus TaxID=101070 RepID=UPI000C9A7D92|nr:3-oxoacyl-[acyl-carrier-protein] reductase [Rummeliibacillus pycnus]